MKVLMSRYRLGDEAFRKNLLLTGAPGCGKTTAIESLVQRIHQPMTGFITREMRTRGRRVGFAITTLDGRRGIMAHVDIPCHQRVGRYGVDLDAIDRIAVPSLVPVDEDVIIVVDEIGKMECLSPMFRQTLMEALDSANRVIGSIALKGGRFITAIKERPDTCLVPVSVQNRQSLVREQLVRLAKRHERATR